MLVVSKLGGWARCIYEEYDILTTPLVHAEARSKKLNVFKDCYRL